MSRIIITGHPSSGLEKAEELLLRCGMRPPLASRREGMFPAEITAAFCKAYGAPSALQPTSEGEFRQLEPGPVWHSLALDLLLGNTDQKLWGWADPQSIFLLDYWLTLDPQATFVLVYDEPQNLFSASAPDLVAAPDDRLVRQGLDNWAAYNGAMLRFFIRNPERCLLVHSRQAAHAADVYLSQLQSRLGASDGSAALHLSSHGATPESHSGHPAPSSPLASDSLATIQGGPHFLASPLPADALQTIQAADTERYLIDTYLDGHPGYTQLYEELQAVANMALDKPSDATINSLMAWKSFLAQRQLLSDILGRVGNDYRIQGELQEHSTKEFELLLNQLRQLQDELESAFIEKQKLRAEAEKLEKEVKYLRTGDGAHDAVVDECHGAADRVRQQLAYRLGATIVSHSRSPGGWIRMPFALVAETFAFRRDKARRGKVKLPPLSSYRDYDKAERVMQQLSYRLGKALLDNIRSPMGWVKLPSAICHQIQEFNTDRMKR